MSGYLSYPILVSAPVVGGGAVGGELLAGETDAMGLDLTYHVDRSKQLYISDLTTPANNYNGDPQAKLTYTSPATKMCRQADGVWRYGSHNLYLNSAAPANQSVTVVSGGTYAVVITGSVSITLSGATTGTVTAGTTNFTASTTTLTCGSTSGSGTVTVYRTPSVGNYLATAGSAVYDLPYHWDAALASQGMLIEEQRTNLLHWSQVFSFAVKWVTGDSSVTDDTQVAPDGTTTADTLTVSGAGTKNPYLSQAYTGTASTTTTVSCFVKKGTQRYISLKIDDATAAGIGPIFDLNTGAYTGSAQVLGSSFTVISASSTVEANGWYRLTAVIGSTNGLTTRSSSLEMRPDGTTTTWTANGTYAGTETVHMWDYQVEEATFASSPIHTVGATATRAVDQITMATSTMPFGATLGTMVVGFNPIANGGAASAYILAFKDANSSPNDAAILRLSTGALTTNMLVTAAAATQADMTTANSVTVGVAAKLAGAWNTNDFAVVLNGGTVVADPSGTIGTSLDIMWIGNRNGIDRPYNGYIRQITYLKRRATNTELQTRTT